MLVSDRTYDRNGTLEDAQLGRLCGSNYYSYLYQCVWDGPNGFGFRDTDLRLANAEVTPYLASKTDTAATTPATPQSSAAIPSPSSTDKDSPAVPATSQAWIAGAVAGPVVGCALVGLLVWWIMRHRMKKAAAAAAAAAGPTPVPTAESARHASSTYGQSHPGSHWSTSSPPPAAMYGGEVPAHGWGPQKPPSPPPVSGGSPAPLHELSSAPGNVKYTNSVVYELPHQSR
ncbi:hypothetical protein PG996_004235 [Apiospora saccharicola]|uniref:Uncharacterized protein n=1 Tax=Apiospora saccharicola TaxID=335842 RepID=A0ABR1W6F0_9PEZI